MNTAEKHLRRDPVMDQRMDSHLPYLWVGKDDVFADLCITVIYQSISAKVAEVIAARFVDLFEQGLPEPDSLMALEFEKVRGVGLSKAKASYLFNIAEYFIQHELSIFEWNGKSDGEVHQLLQPIKGIGPWSIRILLMFTLGRPDVFPVGDLAIQKRMRNMYGLEETGRPFKRKLEEIAEDWRPYRTLACRYIWGREKEAE